MAKTSTQTSAQQTQPAAEQESGRAPLTSAEMGNGGLDTSPTPDRALARVQAADYFARPISNPQSAPAGAPSLQADLAAIRASVDPADRAAFDTNMARFLARRDVPPEKLAEAVAHMRTLAERVEKGIGKPDVLEVIKPRLSELLTSLSAELGNERDRHQGIRALCAETTNRTDMIVEQPEEYVRMWRDLASTGTACWKCETESLALHVDAARMQRNGRPPVGFSGFVFDCSQIQYANQGAYDPIEDVTTRPDGLRIVGTLKEGYQRLRNASCNEATARIDTTVLRGEERGQEAPLDPAELLDIMQRHGEETGRRVMCEIRGVPGSPHALHIVAFMGIDESGNVLIKNPWHDSHGGGIQSIPRGEFLAKLCSGIVPVTALDAADARCSRAVMDLDKNPYMPLTGTIEIHARPPRDEAKTAAASSANREGRQNDGEQWLKRKPEAVEYQHAGSAPGGAAERKPSRGSDIDSAA